MNTIKNPYCLDPKDTRCPRLDKLGMEWDAVNGRLKVIEPSIIDEATKRRVDSILKEPTARGFFPLKSKVGETLSSPDRFAENMSFEDEVRVYSIYNSTIATHLHNLRKAEKLDLLNEYNDYVDGLSSTEPEIDGIKVIGRLGKTLTIYEGDGKLMFSFHGALQGTKDEHFKWLVLLGRDKFVQNSDTFNEIREVINKYIDEYPLDKLEFIGYSLGGYKARLFAGEFGGDAYLFNGHIMPFSELPELTGKAYYHTVMNDDTSFKYWIPYWNGQVTTERDSSNEIHTLYLPRSDVLNEEHIPFRGHTLQHLHSGGERVVPEDYNPASGALGLVGMGLGVADITILASGNEPSRGMETAGAVVGEVQTGIDAPQMSFIEGSANDIDYFMDRFGITDYLKSPERKRQEKEMREEDLGAGTYARDPNAPVTQDTGSSFVMGGKTYYQEGTTP